MVGGLWLGLMRAACSVWFVHALDLSMVYTEHSPLRELEFLGLPLFSNRGGLLVPSDAVEDEERFR